MRNADDYCVKYQSAKAVALVFVGTIALASMANAQSALSIPKPDLEFKGKIGETLKDRVKSRSSVIHATRRSTGSMRPNCCWVSVIGLPHTFVRWSSLARQPLPSLCSRPVCRQGPG